MRVHREAISMALRPVWVSVVVLAMFCSAGASLWAGLQKDAGETSTTFVFGRRVGYLNRPLPILDDHLNEIVNSVEFPQVFARIEERLQLRAERDYDLRIGVVENTQSVVEIEVRTDQSGNADRISRIVAEEMVKFVLASQELDTQTEVDELDRAIDELEQEQSRLIVLAGGVPPTTAQAVFEQILIGLQATDDTDVVGTYEGLLREQIDTVAPLANNYRRNNISIAGLHRARASILVEQSDISASQQSIDREWYRLITPVEATSNVPVAIAMAFAAAVPAGITAIVLVVANLDRRLRRRDAAESVPAEAVAA